jgi:hypothetical protein
MMKVGPLSDPTHLSVDPLVQTQVLGRQDIPINSVFSKRFSRPSGLRLATVVDFVAIISSRFNTVQQAVGNPALKTEDLPRGFQVENLVPNQITVPSMQSPL